MEQKKSYTATLLLSFFLGNMGIHRFYTGHVGIGIVQLLTGGGCGIWSIIDFINLCFNNFHPAESDFDEYNPVLGKTFFFIWLAIIALSILCYAVAIAQVSR